MTFQELVAAELQKARAQHPHFCDPDLLFSLADSALAQFHLLSHTYSLGDHEHILQAYLIAASAALQRLYEDFYSHRKG